MSACDQLVAVIDRAVDESVGIGEVGGTRTLERNTRVGVRLDALLLEIEDGLRAADQQTPVLDLDGYAQVSAAV